VHLIDMTMFYAMQGGGVRTYLAAKARWLAQRERLRYSLVASALRVPDDCAFVAVPSTPLPVVNGYRIPLSIRSTVQTVRGLQPHLIEVGDPYQFAWAAARLKRAAGIPIVAFYHSDVPRLLGQRFGPLARHAAQKYLKLVYRQFDLVLAPSRRMADFLRSLGIERVVQQPLGVDTTVFSPLHRDTCLRARLGLAPQTRLLAYAGRFTAEKKLSLLIDAVQALGQPYHLLLIGGGDGIPNSPQVTILPFEKDSRRLSGLLGGCDLLVHPGDQETFGLVVLEAMASGVPVLGVAAGGVAELVDRRNGMLVAAGSSSALAEGIRILFAQDLAELGRQARIDVCRRYDWNLIFPQLMRHYSGVVQGQQREDLVAHMLSRHD
jgi:alpha-1,6-mannosyltransferase